MLSLICLASQLAALAQSNPTFQNCQPGDSVRVKCDQPLLVLGKATLLEIGSNTVTVATTTDRFTLNKSHVLLVSRERPAEIAAATPTPAAGIPAPDSSDNISQTMESVRAAVIDPHKMEAFKESKLVDGRYELVVDPHSTNGQAKYDKANAYYHQTMNGVLADSVTQADLVQQAKSVLADCDKYAAERKDDPQYEAKIKTLQDFVRRSEAGEKIDFGTPAP